MKRKFAVILLTACLITGCSFVTSGEGAWEVYGGVRTRQLSEQPSKVEIQSTVVDKIVDSLTDGKMSETE